MQLADKFFRKSVFFHIVFKGTPGSIIMIFYLFYVCVFVYLCVVLCLLFFFVFFCLCISVFEFISVGLALLIGFVGLMGLENKTKHNKTNATCRQVFRKI